MCGITLIFGILIGVGVTLVAGYIVDIMNGWKP